MRATDTEDTHSVESLTAAAGERAKSGVDATVNALNAVSGKARELSSSAESYLRRSPWLAVGVAAGVGVLIGFLASGRREP